MRVRAIILTGLALSVLGCVSDPTSVSGDPSLARATTREYTPVHLSTLGDWPASLAYGINAAGQIVGTSAGHAVLWDEGVLKDLGDWGNEYSAGTSATAINNRDQVVGYSYEGVMTDLGTLGGDWSEARAINNAGQIVGYSGTSEQYGIHAFLWNKGAMVDLGTLGGPVAKAFGINEKGDIVGATGIYEGSPDQPTLWTRKAKVK